MWLFVTKIAVWGAVVGVSFLRGADLKATDYRRSGDFSQHVIYVTTNLSLTKVISQDALGYVTISFHLAKSHFERTPELASHTGDTVDVSIATAATRLGITDDGNWLIVQGKEFNESAADYVSRFFAVDLAKGTYHNDRELQGLERKAKFEKPLSTVHLEAVELVFDRMLVTYLEAKGRR